MPESSTSRATWNRNGFAWNRSSLDGNRDPFDANPDRLDPKPLRLASTRCVLDANAMRLEPVSAASSRC
jgi:hypothetical protein